MIIKKYQAANEADAIILAKEELGKNVIIMNVKKVNPKGIARIFKKSRVEVTAAIDDGKSYKAAVEKADIEASATKKAEDNNSDLSKTKDKSKIFNTRVFKLKKDEDELKELYNKEIEEDDDDETTREKLSKENSSKEKSIKEKLSNKKLLGETKEEALNEKNDNESKEKLEEQLYKVLMEKQEEIAKDTSKVKSKKIVKEVSKESKKEELREESSNKDSLDEEVKEELREEIFRAIQQKQESMARKNELKKGSENLKDTKTEIKQEIKKETKAEIIIETKSDRQKETKEVSSKNKTETVAEVHKSEKYVKLIKKQLLKHEVDEKYIDMIINEVKGNIKKDTLVDNILTSVYQKIILKLGTPKLIEPGKESPKYVFFMGPTGVGKTTTIAKIASDFSLNRGLNVALLTSDTYRIAAVEQLRIFANILKVPIHVAYSADDIRKLKSELDKYDIVLIDTAGRSHKNVEQNKDLRELISAIDKKERDMYLVLSATTKYTDLINIIEAYKDIENYKLLFTKTDETTHLGNILNIKLLTNADLSYIANGQDVPEDIGKVDAQEIAKQLLGGGM